MHVWQHQHHAQVVDDADDDGTHGALRSRADLETRQPFCSSPIGTVPETRRDFFLSFSHLPCLKAM